MARWASNWSNTIYHLHYIHDNQEQTVTGKFVIRNRPAAKNKYTNPRIGGGGDIKPLYIQKCLQQLWIQIIRSYFCNMCWMYSLKSRQSTTTRPGHWKLSLLFSYSTGRSTVQYKDNTHSQNWIHGHIGYSQYQWPPYSISPKLRLRTQSIRWHFRISAKWQFLCPPSGYLHLNHKILVDATIIAKPLAASFMKTGHSLVSVTPALVSVDKFFWRQSSKTQTHVERRRLYLISIIFSWLFINK